MREDAELPLAVAAVVRDPSGRYLLIRRAAAVPAPGIWTPVTGRLEPGERLDEAAARECLEEVGLSVRVGPECYRCLTFDGRWRLVWFACEAATTDLRLNPDEVAEARWLSAAEALALEPMFPATRAFYASRVA